MKKKKRKKKKTDLIQQLLDEPSNFFRIHWINLFDVILYDSPYQLQWILFQSEKEI